LPVSSFITLPMPMPQWRLPPLRILLVEPNPDVRESFAAMLSCVGYAVDVATHGAEALSIAGRITPDVVLSELPLNDMSGIELCMTLRSRRRSKHCSFLAITTYCNNDAREAVVNAGFERVLVKPVSLKSIMEALAPIDQSRTGAALLTRQVDLSPAH
jgi:CheY-like chemotaxis protein